MLTVMRFHAPDGGGEDDLGPLLQTAVEAFSRCRGCVSVEVATSVDEPQWWLLLARWSDLGSYRRALSGYDVKMALMPVMASMAPGASVFAADPVDHPAADPVDDAVDGVDASAEPSRAFTPDAAG